MAERLADRLQSLDQRLRDQGAQGAASGGEGRALQQSAGEIRREIEQQRLAERMRQSAQSMRTGDKPSQQGPAAAEEQEDIAAARQESLVWALERGSRSGRVAFQFAKDFSGRRG